MLLSDLRNEYLEKKAQYDAYVKEAGSGEAFDISKLSIEGNTEISKAHSYRKFLESLVESKNALDNVIAMDLATDVLRQVAPNKGAEYSSEAFKGEVFRALAKAPNRQAFKFAKEFKSLQEMKAALQINANQVALEHASTARFTPAIIPEDALLNAMNITTTEHSIVTIYAELRSEAGSPRVRSSTTVESTNRFGAQTATMEPVGVVQPIARELVQDNLRFQTSGLNMLMGSMRHQIAFYAVHGNNVPPQWNGIRNLVAENIPAQDPPNIYSDLRKRIYADFAYGIPTSAIIINTTDAPRITEAIEKAGAKLGETEDLSIHPLGSVLGVPVIPWPHLITRQAFLGPFSTRSELILRNQVEISISSDTPEGFPKNQLVARAAAQGNMVLWIPDEFKRLNNTDRYTI